jgi:hypothetical protein
LVQVAPEGIRLGQLCDPHRAELIPNASRKPVFRQAACEKRFGYNNFVNINNDRSGLALVDSD